jgi:hypothetical protein
MGSEMPALERVTETKANETSFHEVIILIKGWFSYLKRKWYWILLFAAVGGVLGYLYNKNAKTLYVAESSFVLDEETGSKQGGGLAALGVGLGGKSTGFFETADNIIWLYSTRLMIQKTLLSTVDTGNKKVVLINWFLAESGLKKEYDKIPAIKRIKFEAGLTDSTLTRDQNAVISRCAYMIRGRYLKVQLIPKAENVISVTFKSTNELFSALFTNELVKNVNNYYIQTKSKKAAQEVVLLEQKAAQYKSEMSASMYQVASGYDDAPYANPNRTVLRVEPQRKQVDAKLSGEIYGQLVGQLEMSRTNLQKQTPLIQIIEQPIMPLNTEGADPKMSAIIGFLICAVLATGWFILRFQLKKMSLPA